MVRVPVICSLSAIVSLYPDTDTTQTSSAIVRLDTILLCITAVVRTLAGIVPVENGLGGRVLLLYRCGYHLPTGWAGKVE